MSNEETFESETPCIGDIKDYDPPSFGYLIGPCKTPYWRGPGYYLPTEQGWNMYYEYRQIPMGSKNDAIVFNEEEDFRVVLRLLHNVAVASGPATGGMSPRVPNEQLILEESNAWNRTWNGAGLYMKAHNTWIHDQSGANVPKEAVLFINEEDWVKYKYAHEHPKLPGR